MGTATFSVDGNVIVVDDEPEDIVEVSNVSTPVVVPITRTPGVKGNSKGRSRFHNGVCPLHGVAFDGAPCAKFSHLPGSGKGVKQPSPLLFVIVIGRALVKPIGILSLLFVAGYIAIHSLSGITGSLVPKGFAGATDQNGQIIKHDSVTGAVLPSTGATVRPKPSDNATIGGPSSGSNGSGISPKCFQPGNPCHLIAPPAVK